MTGNNVTKLNITKNLVEKIAELLNAEVHYSYLLNYKGEEKRKNFNYIQRRMKQALVYSNGSQESERAKMVLEACGQEVREFLLGVDFSDKQFRAEFGSEAEYPQIAIGLDHRGTLKETLKFMSDKGMFV